MKSYTKIGISCTGGGTLCNAYIGILQVLYENNIKIDFILGSSAGITTTILYGLGYKPIEILEVAKKFSNNKFISTSSILSGNLWDFRKWNKFLTEITNNKNLEDCQIPSFVQAYDVSKRKNIIFEKGKIADLLLITLAFPHLLPKIKYKNRFYRDGWIHGDYEVDFLREKGADIVIGLEPLKEESNSSRKKDRDKLDLAIANVAYRASQIKFDNAERQFEHGYNVGLKYIEEIKNLIK